MNREDFIDRHRARTLGALLDQPDAVLEGMRLPLMWHLPYFAEQVRQKELGTDGHPRRDMADVALWPRRMFAGGRLRLLGGLHVGSRATLVEEVVADVVKDGRRGPARFVTTRSMVSVEGEVVLEEERDVVYLKGPGDAVPSDLSDAAFQPPGREVVVDPTLLFRFSAATSNSHRIHYDLAYSREVEGYPALVVHGPLQALLMADAASALVPATSFVSMTYQLVSPLFAGQGLFVDATPADSGAEVSIRDRSGRVAAKAVVAPG